MAKDQRLNQRSVAVYLPRPTSGGNCCNYKSNYDKRAKGHRCRVCGVVYKALPACS